MSQRGGFTLTEVLVSIALLSVVITAVLQIQQNNLNFLEKFKSSSLNDSYISFVVSNGENRNNDVYISDKVSFKDDDIRKELKEVKVHIKDEKDDDIALPQNDYISNMSSFKSTYTIEDGFKKTFYTFKIE